MSTLSIAARKRIIAGVRACSLFKSFKKLQHYTTTWKDESDDECDNEVGGRTIGQRDQMHANGDVTLLMSCHVCVISRNHSLVTINELNKTLGIRLKILPSAASMNMHEFRGFSGRT